MNKGETFQVCSATAEEWPGIIDLLAMQQLPVSDIQAGMAADFLVAKGANGLVGCIGCERRGNFALIRSLAVRADCRGSGIGKRLNGEMELRCKAVGVTTAYLLTETAVGFAEKQGYRRIERVAVPVEIQSTSQFDGLCPCCATCMAQKLYPPEFSGSGPRIKIFIKSIDTLCAS